jgi:tetratricopeptide (TPR) repeat protein
MTEQIDLTSYLLGERSELRPLIEAIAEARDDRGRERAAVEYLLVLAAARQAARGEPAETGAMKQVHSRYYRVFSRDETSHGRILRELHESLTSGSPAAVVTALKLLGLHHRKMGAYKLARAGFAVSAEVAKQLPDLIEQLNALFWLGVMERYLGDLDSAERVHQDQLEKARLAGSRGQAVLAQENLGLVSLRRGRVAEARSQVMKALQEAQELDDRELEGYCYHSLLLVETTAGRPGQAASCGWEAYRRYESTDQRMRAIQDCGAIFYEAGMLDAAKAAYEIVLSQTEDAASKIRAKTGLADVAAASGDAERFERICQQLLSDERLHSLPFELASTYRTIGIGYAMLDKEHKARSYLEESLALAERHGLAAEMSTTREALAKLPAGARLFRPLPQTGTDYERLADVGKNVETERARLSA